MEKDRGEMATKTNDNDLAVELSSTSKEEVRSLHSYKYTKDKSPYMNTEVLVIPSCVLARLAKLSIALLKCKKWHTWRRAHL